MPFFSIIVSGLTSILLAQGTLPSAHLDPATGDCIIQYKGTSGNLIQTTWVLPNKLTPSVQAQVLIDSSGLITYSYVVGNAGTSLQPVASFDLEVGDTNSVTAGNPPDKWIVTQSQVDSFILWGAKSRGRILPGYSRAGFNLTSTLLPGVGRTRVTGHAPPESYPEEPPEELLDLIPTNCGRPNNIFVLGSSIAPLQSPAGLSPLQMMDNLITLKHQALSLSWIFGPGADGIATSLDAKLDAARKAIQEGDNKAALNQLNAFINELDAQRGKHVNDNAYFLLKVNAQVIISKLQ